MSDIHDESQCEHEWITGRDRGAFTSCNHWYSNGTKHCNGRSDGDDAELIGVEIFRFCGKCYKTQGQSLPVSGEWADVACTYSTPRPNLENRFVPRADFDEALALLKEAEFMVGTDAVKFCPVCTSKSHCAADCRLAAFLAKWGK